MDVPDNRAAVEGAYDDLLCRSLSKIKGDLARLIYVASTRDYNTGKYQHDGLAARFQAEIAGQALEMAHREIFHRLAEGSLQEPVGEGEIYVSSSRQSRPEILEVGQKLEPYREWRPRAGNRPA